MSQKLVTRSPIPGRGAARPARRQPAGDGVAKVLVGPAVTETGHSYIRSDVTFSWADDTPAMTADPSQGGHNSVRAGDQWPCCCRLYRTTLGAGDGLEDERCPPQC